MTGNHFRSWAVDWHFEKREAGAEIEKRNSQNDCSNQINLSRHSEKAGQNTEWNQNQGISHNAPRRGPSIFFNHRQHTNPATRVIFTVEPCDGKEMRALPHKQNSKQDQGAPLQMAARCGPT